MKKGDILKRYAHELWEMLKLLDPERNAQLGPYGQIRYRRHIPRSTYHKRIYKFEKQGLLRRKKTTIGNAFVITEKAKKLRRKPTIKINRIDGHSSLIIFDIPEQKKNARHNLRRFLIRNGYTQIRESCFLSPYKVSDDIIDLIKEMGLEKNVSIFSAKSEYLF